MTHEYGSWYIAPVLDRTNEWAAGWADNDFATKREAEYEIAQLAYNLGTSPSRWAAFQRTPPPANRLWWISEDGQDSLDCGSLGRHGTNNMEVHSAIAMQDLLRECATDNERDSIRRGSMVWRKEGPA